MTVVVVSLASVVFPSQEDVMQLQFPDPPTDTAVAAVLYNATRVGPQSQEEMEARWRTLSSQLAEQGAGTELLEVLSQRVLEHTGSPSRHGRLLVASPYTAPVDRLLTGPPARGGRV